MEEILSTDSITQRNVKRHLNARGWSRRRLANESKLAQSTITDFFAEGHRSHEHTLEAICRALDIPVSQLYEKGGRRTELSEKEIELLLLWHCVSDEVQKSVMTLLYSCEKARSVGRTSEKGDDAGQEKV